VALVRIGVSEESIAFIIRVAKIVELGTLAITSNGSMLRRYTNVVPSSPILVTLITEAISFSETSVLTRATRRNIPEESILHSHLRENLISYIAITGWAL
jgi:hypothetical protein